MKRLLALLLIPVAILSAKLYLESRYEKQLDKAIQQAKMFADISYGKVNINLDGSVAINNIRIRPLEKVDEIKIGSIEFYSNDKSYLYDSNAFREKVPELARWKVNSVEIDPSGYFYSQIKGDGKECVSFPGNEPLDVMGIDKIVSDWTLEIRHSEYKEATIQVNAMFHDMQSFTASSTADISGFSPASVMRGSKPKLKAMDFTFSVDEQYAQKGLEYCAKKLNISSDEYLNQVIGSADYMASAGITLGDALTQALQHVMSGKSQIHISAKPSEQINDLSQLAFYKPKDAIKLLNLEVNIDGKKVEDLSFTQINKHDGESPTSLARVLSEFSKKENQKNIPSNDRSDATEDMPKQHHELASNNSKGYTEIKRGEAGKYLGHIVKIKRKSAPVMEGKLVSTDKSRLKIQQRRYGGTVDFPIRFSDIKSIEVYL